jgi:hypothetical protein
MPQNLPFPSANQYYRERLTPDLYGRPANSNYAVSGHGTEEDVLVGSLDLT